MALALNKDTKSNPNDPANRESLDNDLKLLETVLSSSTLRQERKWESSQRLNIKIGLTRYQLEASDDSVLEAFRAAATAGSSLWEVCKEPLASHEYLTLKNWSWLIAFGSEAERKALCKVDPQLFARNASKDYVEIRALLRLLQGYFATGVLDITAADAVVAAAGQKKASRVDATTAKPYAQGLIALARGNADEWNAAMAALVKDHEHDAFRGELVDLSAGYMACIPLSLLRLGLERGLVCTIKSLHLPVRLVEQAWKLSVSG